MLDNAAHSTVSMLSVTKRTPPSTKATLQPPGCSAYIWHTCAARSFGGWTTPGSDGAGPLCTKTSVAAASASVAAIVPPPMRKPSPGMLAPPTTVPAHAFWESRAVCSPRITVFDVPSTMSAMRTQESRYNGPLATPDQTSSGADQGSACPALPT